MKPTGKEAAVETKDAVPAVTTVRYSGAFERGGERIERSVYNSFWRRRKREILESKERSDRDGRKALFEEVRFASSSLLIF